MLAKVEQRATLAQATLDGYSLTMNLGARRLSIASKEEQEKTHWRTVLCNRGDAL